MDNRLEAAKELLMNIPPYCESQALTLAKVKLKDGRDAVLRLQLTTVEEEVQDAVIWVG